MTLMDGRRPRVLVVAQRLPLPPKAGVDLRGLQTVTGLARTPEGAALRLEARGTDPVRRAPHVLKWLREPTGHPYDRYVTPGTIAEVEALLEEFQPDVAVAEILWMGGYVDVLARGGRPVVLNAHNVEAPLHRDVR